MTFSAIVPRRLPKVAATVALFVAAGCTGTNWTIERHRNGDRHLTGGFVSSESEQFERLSAKILLDCGSFVTIRLSEDVYFHPKTDGRVDVNVGNDVGIGFFAEALLLGGDGGSGNLLLLERDPVSDPFSNGERLKIRMRIRRDHATFSWPLAGFKDAFAELCS